MAYNEVRYEQRSEFSVTCKMVNGVQHAAVHTKVIFGSSATLVRYLNQEFKLLEVSDEAIRNQYRKSGHKYIDTVIVERDPETGRRREWQIWFETSEKGSW